MKKQRGELRDDETLERLTELGESYRQQRDELREQYERDRCAVLVSAAIGLILAGLFVLLRGVWR